MGFMLGLIIGQASIVGFRLLSKSFIVRLLHQVIYSSKKASSKLDSKELLSKEHMLAQLKDTSLHDICRLI